MILNMSGGGAPLNFKVVGNPQPQNPSVNTIWVNTDVKITGWVFSATQPEAMEEGAVWFHTGTSTAVAFNALKKNNIQVYPLTAMQCIGGEWVGKSAETFMDGEWKSWILYAYNSGDENVDVTGGWDWNVYEFSWFDKGTFEKRDSEFYIFRGAMREVGVATNEPIDVTAYKTLYVEVSYAEYYAGDQGGPDVNVGVDADRNKVAYTCAARVALTQAGTYTIDLSAINGPVYISIGSAGNSGHAIANISKIYMR